VPVLVMNDGTVLVESGAILDAIDDLAGPARDQLHERMVRPPEKYHQPWVSRCREQMHGALGALEASCRERAPGSRLVDDRLTQADVTVACLGSFLDDSLDVFGSAEAA
jgi:glutathione S-transferase